MLHYVVYKVKADCYFDYYIDNNCLINRCNTIKDLDVLFESSFTFIEHIRKSFSSAYQTLGFTKIVEDFKM